jgi:hypothetical protein
MGASMTKEEQYKIAMIALAGSCGVLLIGLIIVICCCMKYQRQLHGSRAQRTTLSRLPYEQPHYPSMDANEPYTAKAYHEGVQSHTYEHAGMMNHSEPQNYASPYHYAPPAASYNVSFRNARSSSASNKTSGVIMSPGFASSSNSFPATSACKPKTGNEYGKVLLNPPSAVCTKPAMPSTRIGGSCGTGGGCDGKFFSMPTGQPLQQTSTAAHFVLESGASMQL